MEDLRIELLDVYVYSIVAEYLKVTGHVETGKSAIGLSTKLSDAEVIFVFLIACEEYGGNVSKAQGAMFRYGNIKSILHKSQFNR